MTDPGPTEEEFGVPIPGPIRPEAEWARTGFKRWPPPGPLDWGAIFGRRADLVLELGCGNGRFTLLSALARPDHDHFAVDLLPVVIRYATRRANQRGLHNVRFAVRDAQSFLAGYVGDGSAAEVHIYHPQPYHDPRRAHLRLLRPRFLADLHRVLRPGGLLVVQTDNPDYWSYLARSLPFFFAWAERADPWPDAPEGRSRREIVARARGLRIYRGEGRRLDHLSPAEVDDRVRILPEPTFRSQGPWCELDAREAGEGPPGPRRPPLR